MNYVTALMITLLLSGGIMAQQKKSPEERAHMQTSKMSKELNLSADQKEKIYQINLEANQKNDVLRSSRMNEAAKKRRLHNNNETRKEKIRIILTSKQVNIMEQKIAARKVRRKQFQKSEK